MPPPSKLAVATSSVLRLVKEEASYHKEAEQQEARIKKLETAEGDENENAEYTLRQERQALQETKNVLPNMKIRIAQALEKLEEELESKKEAEGETSTEEIKKAEDAIVAGKKVVSDAS